MVQKFEADRCASCGGSLPAQTGPGRPATYCSEPCRRVAGFAIRGLVRRIDRYELELREIRAGGAPVSGFDDDERRSRARWLRRWLKEDRAKLRTLLGNDETEKST